MVYEYPNDPRVRCEDVDFMLGSSLLAACVVEKGAKRRSVYLPQGEVFYDFVTRQRHLGGQVVTVDAPLDSTPLFQRGGSILPLQNNNCIELWICPDKACSFTLYEDDGISNDYLRGQYSATRYNLTESGDLVILESEREGSFLPTDSIHYAIQCVSKAPAGILWNGNPLPQILDEDRFREASEGWHYDHSTKVGFIKCGNGRKLSKLIVNFGKFDLIRMDEN